MAYQNLEEAIQAARSPVDLLRNSSIGPYAFPVVRAEFTNWRDEQRAWRETCALFDQSHHMTDLYLEGPDALKLLSDLGVNSFKNFKVDHAKQFVACNQNGYVIGDAILFYLDENRFSLVGRPPASNWVQYNLETGRYNASAERDERSAVNQGRRKVFRYQVQGPTAPQVMEKVTGRPLPEIRFFNMGAFTIAGRDVRALHRGDLALARAHGRAVHVHRTRTALVDPAAVLGALEVEVVAEHPQQWSVVCDVDRGGLAVDLEGDCHGLHRSVMSWFDELLGPVLLTV